MPPRNRLPASPGDADADLARVWQSHFFLNPVSLLTNIFLLGVSRTGKVCFSLVVDLRDEYRLPLGPKWSSSASRYHNASLANVRVGRR